MTTRVKSPILVVGSPRSGTTMLGEIFTAHPEVAYWEEPRTIWSQGNAWRSDDVLDESHLTASIARRIDRRFHRFLEKSGCPRFAEKTPGNTLRLRFIHGIYPDARVIHVIRDGRAVVASALSMLETPPRAVRIFARLKETPLREFPALAPIFFRDVILRRLTGGRKSFWGPRPPGWQDWLDLPAPVMLARQWAYLVRAARRDLEIFPAEQRLEIRYEDFVSEPEKHWAELERFAQISSGPDFSSWTASHVYPASIDAWKSSLDAEIVRQIEDEAGDLLEELGYL